MGNRTKNRSKKFQNRIRMNSFSLIKLDKLSEIFRLRKFELFIVDSQFILIKVK